MTEERPLGGPGDGPSRPPRRLLPGIFLLLALLLLVASRTQRGGIPAGVAASDHEHMHAASQDFVTVRVEMTEFAFRPATLRLPRAWPVKVVLVNRGQLAHQFETAALRALAVTVWNETLHVESAGVHHVRLQPGATATLQFHPLTAGRFALACTIEGHREAGMKGVVEVR
ncbi:MAG: cupredoxin domain-containing protein [bacterium]